MYKEVFKWEAIGALVIFILGSLFHFVYNWSGQWKHIAFIVPVNESVWEHLKLVLWPTLTYAAFEYNRIKDLANNFWTAKTAGIYFAMILIVVIFYLYTSIFGLNLLVVDILTFLVSVSAGQLLSFKILTMEKLPESINKLSIPLLILLVLIFFIFTFFTPRLPIFKNPLDGTYGI